MSLLPHTLWIPSILPLSENVLLQWKTRASLALEPGLFPRFQCWAGVRQAVLLCSGCSHSRDIFNPWMPDAGLDSTAWNLSWNWNSGKLENEMCNNKCGGVVHCLSLPSPSGRPINLLNRHQDLINCFRFLIPSRSSNPFSDGSY